MSGQIDDDEFILVWPKPKPSRRDDEDTEEIPTISLDDQKEFCTRCFLNRKKVDYGVPNRKPFWSCPGCGDVIEED